MEGPLDELALRARAGDDAARHHILDRYAPFALKIAARVAGKYIEAGRDDEASVALMALNEAIDSFSASGGSSFLSLAGTIIRRRLIDHARRSSSERREVPLSSLMMPDAGDEGAIGDSPSLAQRALELHDSAERRRELRDEIGRYVRELNEFGLTLAELARVSPRREDARDRAKRAAHQLAGDGRMWDEFRRTGNLPLVHLAARAEVSRKTLERHRKYIIAIALISAGDYTYLRDYIRVSEWEGSS